MPRRSRRATAARLAEDPQEAALRRARLDFAERIARDLADALGIALQDTKRRGLSAIAPAGWPILHPATRSDLATTAARLRQAWAEEREATITPDAARQIAHWLEAFALLARAEWAMAATGPLGPSLLRATRGANDQGRGLPSNPRGSRPPAVR